MAKGNKKLGSLKFQIKSKYVSRAYKLTIHKTVISRKYACQKWMKEELLYRWGTKIREVLLKKRTQKKTRRQE